MRYMKKNLLTNIRNFIEGYSRLFYNRLIGLPKYQQEQIEYRTSLCKDDCAKQGKCIVCSCTFPDRLFTITTCNKDRFPDILNEEEWKQYKKDNGLLY